MEIEHGFGVKVGISHEYYTCLEGYDMHYGVVRKNTICHRWVMVFNDLNESMDDDIPMNLLML